MLKSRLSDHGFTLVELIVLMVLMGLILGLVGMNFSRSLPRAKLMATVRDFSSTLRYAKNNALINNKEVTVTIDLNRKQYRLSKKENVRFSDDVVITVIDPDDSKVAGEKYSIVFYPGGGSSGAEVIIQGKKGIYSVKVDPLTGNVINRSEEQ